MNNKSTKVIYSSNDEILRKLDKFCFLIEIETLASHCFIFSLRSVQQILSIFGFCGSFYGIYLGINADSYFDKVHHISMDIASFIICCLILLSTFTFNSTQAFYGYTISVSRSFLYLIVNGLKMLIECSDHDMEYNLKRFLHGLLSSLIVLFFTWINYSYTKKLVNRELPEFKID